jgi:GrpB-like predicted nucleotidyltransferase (UPF0157 family)
MVSSTLQQERNCPMKTAIPVHLVDYDASWPDMAGLYAGQLHVLGPTLIAVHHIGSTAVPGLSGKPVIDLMPIVTSLEELDSKQVDLESVGFIWLGEFGVEGRRFCALNASDGRRLVQLHIYATGNPNARRQLAFRDYLRAFPDVAVAYEAEKRRARELYPDDSHAYSAEKGAFIREVEAEALDWFVGEPDLI